MKKHLRWLVSVALLVAVLMGFAVPASAAVLPMSLTWHGGSLLDTKIERVEGFSADVSVYYFRPGSEIDITLAPGFEGKLQAIYIQVAGTNDRVYFFDSSKGNCFEGATIQFTVGTTPDGAMVSLSDPNEVYILTAEAIGTDGSALLQRACYRIDPNPPVFQISDDGTLISYDAYYGEAGHVTIPDGVTTIGQEVFSFRDDITGVTIPNSVTSIKSGAFNNCTGLTEIVVPDSVTTIGSWAFSGCSGLKEVVIPDSVTELGRSAFSGCTALERVVIGSGITKIERDTFADCSNLKSVVMGQNVACIGDSAFAWCTGLTSLTLPQSVEYIGIKAFRDCSSLAEITIPETTVVSNMQSVFDGCPLLDIPLRDRDMASGKIVGYSVYTTDTEYVFNLLFLYKDGTLDPLVDEFDVFGWDYYKNQMPQDRYGGNLGEYGRKTYGKLLEEASTEIILPEGVKTLAHLGWGDYNSIERLVLPNSLQVIGDGSLAYDTFYGCTDLKEIVFPSPENVSPALKYQDLESFLAQCPSLEEIINFPNQAFQERVAANQRIEAAWKGIDPKTILAPQSKRITDLSNQICAGCTTDYEKARAVFDWMAANIVYDYDYYHGFKSTVTIEPEEVLDSKLTICDGYARLTQALLLVQNIPAVYIDGPVNNGSGTMTKTSFEWEDHAWNMAYVDGRWIYIDSTWGRTADGKCNPYWFDPSLTALSMSHWGQNSYADPNAHHYVGRDDTPTEFAATPNRSTVLVNGQNIAFDAYTINQNNYFKLRDLAKVLSGTGKQFEVTWDGSNNAINMLPGKPYTAVGGELAQGDGTDKTASINTATIYLNGQPVSLLAYTINQNNYFKLRDVGQAFNFDVTWDGANNTIAIDTTQSYTAD